MSACRKGVAHAVSAAAMERASPGHYQLEHVRNAKRRQKLVSREGRIVRLRAFLPAHDALYCGDERFEVERRVVAMAIDKKCWRPVHAAANPSAEVGANTSLERVIFKGLLQ